MHSRDEKMQAFGRLLDVMDELREKCPWDRVQTNESLRQNTIEEVYELCDALIKNDNPNICKELGDVLLVDHSFTSFKRPIPNRMFPASRAPGQSRS